MQLEIALRLLIENDFKKQTVGENSFVSIEIPQQTTTVDKKNSFVPMEIPLQTTNFRFFIAA